MLLLLDAVNLSLLQHHVFGISLILATLKVKDQFGWELNGFLDTIWDPLLSVAALLLLSS